MNTKTKSLIIASIVSGVFLAFTVFSSSSAFNYIPYLIHESFSPGGKSESEFIILFDCIFAVLIFALAYWLMHVLFDK